MQLQQLLQESVYVPRSVAQIQSALPKAKMLIILLHNGILYDPAFAGKMSLRNASFLFSQKTMC